MNELYKKHQFQSWKRDIEQTIPKTLEEYLDWFDFVNFTEVVCAVWDYFQEFYKEDSPAYSDLVHNQNVAEEYCIKKWILWFDDLQELKDKIEELENFDYSYNESDNYMKACELCWKDPRENWDFTDEECIIEQVKQKADEWDLQSIKNMLEDIDLNNSYFMYDWYWRPRNIERYDSEYVIDEKLKELKKEYENTLDILQSWE